MTHLQYDLFDEAFTRLTTLGQKCCACLDEGIDGNVFDAYIMALDDYLCLDSCYEPKRMAAGKGNGNDAIAALLFLDGLIRMEGCLCFFDYCLTDCFGEAVSNAAQLLHANGIREFVEQGKELRSRQSCENQEWLDMNQEYYTMHFPTLVRAIAAYVPLHRTDLKSRLP